MDNNNEKVETKEEIVDMQAETAEIEKKASKKENKFIHGLKVLLSGVLDQIVAVAIALGLYGLLSLVLKLAGYKIDMQHEMFLIVYIISNVLYYPLVQELLSGKTLGKKLMFR